MSESRANQLVRASSIRDPAAGLLTYARLLLPAPAVSATAGNGTRVRRPYRTITVAVCAGSPNSVK